MDLASDDKIYSATVQIGHLDLTSKDKGKLDNLDAWAAGKDGVVSESYTKDVFDKITGKKEEKEEKKENGN